jgi:hypothetical protein
LPILFFHAAVPLTTQSIVIFDGLSESVDTAKRKGYKGAAISYPCGDGYARQAAPCPDFLGLKALTGVAVKGAAKVSVCFFLFFTGVCSCFASHGFLFLSGDSAPLVESRLYGKWSEK